MRGHVTLIVRRPETSAGDRCRRSPASAKCICGDVEEGRASESTAIDRHDCRMWSAARQC